MSPRGLLALVLLLGCAVGALYWLDHRKPKDAAASVDLPLLAAFTEDAIRRIEIACDASALTLTHEGTGRWSMAQPFAAEADPRRVRELITALQDARVRKVIAEKADSLAAFGLEPAACRVSVELAAQGGTRTLRLGRGSPVGTERYASVDGARVVFADATLYSVMSRDAAALREKRLFPVEPEDVTHLELTRPDGRLALARDGDRWRLEAPVGDAASASAAAGLVRAAVSLEVSDAGAAGLPSIVKDDRRVAVTIATKGAPSPVTAYVATKGIAGTRFSWRRDGTLAGLVAESAAAELDRPADGVRELQVVSFSVPDVRSVAIERAAATLRVTRASEGKPWTGLNGAAPFAVDDARISELLDRLRSVRASGFASAAPASAATATIVVSGEKAELARLTYGPAAREAGSSEEALWVVTPARPGVVFSVPASHLGPIPGRASDLAVP